MHWHFDLHVDIDDIHNILTFFNINYPIIKIYVCPYRRFAKCLILQERFYDKILYLYYMQTKDTISQTYYVFYLWNALVDSRSVGRFRYPLLLPQAKPHLKTPVYGHISRTFTFYLILKVRNPINTAGFSYSVIIHTILRLRIYTPTTGRTPIMLLNLTRCPVSRLTQINVHTGLHYLAMLQLFKPVKAMTGTCTDHDRASLIQTAHQLLTWYVIICAGSPLNIEPGATICYTYTYICTR